MFQDAPREFGREDSTRRARDQGLERDALAEVLLDEIEVARRADRLKDFDEVAVRQELREDRRLAEEPSRDEWVVRVELRVLKCVLLKYKWMMRSVI